MRFEFLDFVLDTNTHALTLGGAEQKIEPQVFDLLRLLLEHAGALVTRDQLIEEIWDGRIVSESAISACIAAARRVVGDDGKKQAVIRTVARRGLQFVAQLKTPEKPNSPNVSQASETLKIRYATTRDGAKLAYAEHGIGLPLVRIGHFPSHLELDWNESFERACINAYCERYRLIRLDHRGSGLSEPDISGWSIHQQIEDVCAVVDALGLTEFALMGTSSGAQVAVGFAAKYPKRVSKLITQGGYVDGRSIRNTDQGDNNPEILAQMMHEGWELGNTAFVAAVVAIYQPGASPEVNQQVAANFKASSTAESAEFIRGVFNSRSIAKYLGDVRAPTLVLHSRDDAVHPLSEARKMASGIEGAELVVLESPNHYVMPHEAAWDVHLSALFEFLDRST